MKLAHRRERGVDSGQTSVDFLIGFSIFAVTLLFVLQMASVSVVNSAPQSPTQEAMSDRAAAFAHHNVSEENGSFSEAHQAAVESLRTGNEREYSLNFTAKNVSEGGGVSFRAGDDPANTTASIAGQKRVVSYDYDGEDDLHLLEIQVWENSTG